MKTKQIKRILSDTYYKGLYAGLDITKGNQDEYFGDRFVREIKEQEFLKKQYKILKLTLEVKEKGGIYEK